MRFEDHFFQQRAQEFLAIAVGDGRRSPDLTNIGAENLNAFELLGAKRVGPLLLAAAQFRFGGGQIAQAILPFGFQSAGHQSIFRLYSPISAFGPFRLVARPLHFQPPLRQSRVMVGLELLDREHGGFHGCRRDGFEKSVGHGLLDRHTADVEAVLRRGHRRDLCRRSDNPEPSSGRDNGHADRRPQWPQVAMPCNSAEPSLTAPPD